MREGRCISLIERLKQGSELKLTLSIGRLFQYFINYYCVCVCVCFLYLFFSFAVTATFCGEWWSIYYHLCLICLAVFSVSKDAETNELRVISDVYKVTASVSEW